MWTRSDVPLDVGQIADASNDKQPVIKFLRGEPAAPMPAPAAPGGGVPEAQIPAPGAPEGGRPAKRARPGTQGPREASPDPFADGFKRDRRGIDGSDYEGDDDEPPRGSPAQELERLWGLHQAGAITLREFNALKKATIAELAPVKKEERKVKQEQAPRTPIKRDPEGVRIKKEPGKVAGATEKSTEQRVIEAKPVDKQTM